MKLFNTLREDLKAHSNDWTRPGFHAVAVHRFGTWRMKLPTLMRKPCSAVYHAAHVFCRNVYGIELPDSARVGRRVCIEHQSGIVIHGNAVIGDDVTIRQGVTIGNLGSRDAEQAPIIGDGTDIGANAVILGNIRVGRRAQIGAGAIVVDDVPASKTAISPKARIISSVRSAT